MTYMVPMELLVLPEDEEGTNWRGWYTNQGVERARPPPKPNDERRPSLWYHSSTAHDWYRVPDDDFGSMTSTTGDPYRPHPFPQYDGSSNYTNQGDGGERVSPPPRPNEGQWGYHSIADWYRVPAPSSPTYDDGTTSTAPQRPHTNDNKLVWIDNHNRGTDRQAQLARSNVVTCHHH